MSHEMTLYQIQPLHKLIKPPVYSFHKWLPIINSFVNVKISLTNLAFESIIQFLLPNELSWADLNAYKIILNWQRLMKRVYVVFNWLLVTVTGKLQFQVLLTISFWVSQKIF